MGTAGSIVVFIENEAGSDVKHHYDERTLQLRRTERVGAAYPYPYGFVPDTLAPDGDAADCFVLSPDPLPSGATVEVEAIALLEQTEGGITDHNVLAVPSGVTAIDLAGVRETIGRFFERFMAGVPGREARMGRLLPAEDAAAYLHACRLAWQHSERSPASEVEPVTTRTPGKS